MQSEHNISVSVMATTKAEAEQKAKLLAEIGQFVNLQNLQVLAKAARKPNINKQIDTFKSFLL